MIKILRKSIKDKKLVEIKKPEKGSWLFVVDPNDKEIKFLQEKFKLDLDIFEDWQDENELPHIEKDSKNNYVYIIARTPVVKNEDVSVVQFSAEWCAPCKSLKPIMDILLHRDCERVNKSFFAKELQFLANTSL